MEATIAKIKKNGKTEIWIQLKVFNGRQYVDLREHFLLADDREWHPTKKGVMVPVELLPAVIDCVNLLDGETELGTVAGVLKSSRDELRIGFREFAGTRFGELRTWYADCDDAGAQMKPSSKGVTFKLELVGAVVEALREAECQLG